MATRPVFIPNYKGPRLVEERFFDFPWASGFAESQKKKNVMALHAAARRNGIGDILEISTKSEQEVGRRLSAFSLKIELSSGVYPLESVYQGSKVFEECGPFPAIFSREPRAAKQFIRETNCGRLLGFELEGKRYPLSPKNAFYDWLYIRCLAKHADWIRERVAFQAFTDIEFNPEKQVNCQARAFAEFKSLLDNSSRLARAVRDFDYFASLLSPI
ncbi:hypothetical protein I6F11_24320 [Ensifer sp. NBAIM29]|nr:hypothetical protein [Ensifer sp. NBAIM29]